MMDLAKAKGIENHFSSSQLPSISNFQDDAQVMKKRPNDIKEIRGNKHLERVQLDLDSPLLRKACYNLGIDVEDCKKKSIESFK
mmetsp:Transcript_29451/g.21904  ORF Transcript_29451/g.21904 Transcript_29451/m.21904 type:complete len:84 (+) Transcript_29451:3-254(+)